VNEGIWRGYMYRPHLPTQPHAPTPPPHTLPVSQIHAACMGGHVSAVEHLISKGALDDCADDRGVTPLHVLCMPNPDEQFTTAEPENARDRETCVPIECCVSYCAGSQHNVVLR
jgi:ankyrin repeat protein